MWAFAKLDVIASAIAMAAVFAGLLALVTLGLVIKGAPAGIPVGPHLAGLAAVFPGYTVTYGGAFVGALYAALAGAVLGLLVAGIWNAAHALFLAIVRTRTALATYEID